MSRYYMYVKISIKLLPFSRDSQIKLVKTMEKFEKISMIKETASFAISFFMPLEQIVIKLHVQNKMYINCLLEILLLLVFSIL